MTRAQEFVLGESNEQLTDQTNLQLSNLIKNDGFKKSYLVAYVFYSQKNNYNINKLDKNSNSSSNKSSSSRNRNRNRSNSRSKSSSTA